MAIQVTSHNTILVSSRPPGRPAAVHRRNPFASA